MQKLTHFRKGLSGLTPAQIDELIAARRCALATQAAEVYGETKSLRKTAEQLHVSHELVRTLLAEADGERDSG